jgi:fumarate reductase subunit D
VKFVHRLEPVLRGLFGAGGFVAALFLPALMFGVALALPLGWFGDRAVDYHRLYGLVSNPAGRVIVFGVVSLVYWHAAHHVRHLMVEIGLKAVELPICVVVYGLALLGTLASLVTVVGL